MRAMLKRGVLLAALIPGVCTMPGSDNQSAGASEGPPEVSARIRLIRQNVYREDGAFARGGTVQAVFFPPQALPADTRTRWTSNEGETCTYEQGTQWPTLLDGHGDGNGNWPTGPFADAGKLLFHMGKGSPPVIYHYFDGFYFRAAPAAARVGGWVHNAFFDPIHLPHGATVRIEAVGGAAVAAFSLEGAALPADFTVTTPDLALGANIIDVSRPLPVAWFPADASGRMVVLLKDAFSFVRCDFIDDGNASVPVRAIRNLVGGDGFRITVQVWRERTQRRTVTDAIGRRVDVDLVTRLVKIGRFASVDYSRRHD